MIIVTEKSKLADSNIESADLERLKELQSKLNSLLKSGAFAQFSMDCNICGKKEKVMVKANSSLTFLNKIFSKVIK